MQRLIRRLADQKFDLLVIGGGITGACIARDAALRGLSVALVEKSDFSGATSANNTKLIHGGLRYLRNFEVGLVREALRERRIWQRIAPHQVQPLPFLVPLMGEGLAKRAWLEAGLTLYDLLSYDRARLDDPFQRLPGHSWLSRREVAKREPILDDRNLEGAFIYYDAQMYSPERLALECVIDAADHAAVVANYVAARALIVRNGRVIGCAAADRIGAENFDIEAKQTIVCAGPWADLFLEQALGKPPVRRLKRSKGIHVIVPARTNTYALTMAAGDEHFFVLPWRGHTLLGTTDTGFCKSPDENAVEPGDIAAFFAFIQRYLPNARLEADKVEHAYAGLRPLVDDGSSGTYGVSRRAEIVDHAKEDGVAGLLSVIGGKWTSSRFLAEKAVDALFATNGRPAPACRTSDLHLPGGAIDRIAEFEAAQIRACPQIAGMRHIVRQYGTRCAELWTCAQARPDLTAPIGITGDIAVQVVHAVRTEMAMTVQDVVLRRTGIGQLGRPSAEVLARVAELMAGELGWDRAHQAREVEAASVGYTSGLHRTTVDYGAAKV
jgi:glycerol-3-phosphate dehydrogenase